MVSLIINSSPQTLLNFPLSSIALLGNDFHFTSDLTTHFPPSLDSQQLQCQQISIEDDAILENTEYFQVSLIPPVGVARLQVGVAEMRVAITDNDEVQVGFTETEIEVNEDGSAEERRREVCVRLEGEIEREVGVAVFSQPGNAHGKYFIRIRTF